MRTEKKMEPKTVLKRHTKKSSCTKTRPKLAEWKVQSPKKNGHRKINIETYPSKVTELQGQRKHHMSSQAKGKQSSY